MRPFLRALLLSTTCASAGLVLTSGSLHAAQNEQPLAAAEKSPEGLLVRSIRIDVAGASSAEPSDGDAEFQNLIKNLKTQKRAPFSQLQFDLDLKFLAKEFDKIEPVLAISGDEVSILITATKKPTIKAFHIVGNSIIDTQRISKECPIHEGDLLDRQSLFKGVQKIRAYYLKKGYFEATVVPTIEKGPQDTVVITVRIVEGRAGFIDKIRIHGVPKEEKSDLLDMLATREYNFLLSWLTQQGTYYTDAVKQDEQTIVSYEQNKGFLDTKVEAKITPSKKRENRINLDFFVDRGGKYFLGNVHFDSSLNSKAPIFTQEELLAKSGLVSGSAYSPEEVRLASRKISNAYGARGYVDVSIIPDMKLVSNEKKEPVYDLSFTIREGNRFRVGLIRIVGNRKTDSSVILHETPLIPGAIFDATLISKTEEKLRNIGYFKSVNVYAVKSTEQQFDGVPLRDIHIEVEEAPTTAQFSMFGGYNTTESISGGFNLSENNFKMSGFSTLFSKGFRSLRGGGEYIGLNATIGLLQSSTTLSWTKPYFLDSKWAFGVDLQRMNNAFAASDYTIKSEQATCTFRRPINAFLSFETHYRLHHAIIDLKGVKHIRKNRELIRESKNGGTISAVGVGLKYDSTEHPVNPRTGIRATLSAEYAGLGGDHHFANYGYLNTFFFPVAERGVIKIKGNVQLIQPVLGTTAARLPMDERLYLGGEGTVRGYRYNTVGPAFHDVKKTPRGGLTSLLGSCEYEHRLTKRFAGFAFFDAGALSWKMFHVAPPIYSTGFGLKLYITDTAPLTIGYGVPLNVKNKHNVQRFYFSIGTNF